MKDAETVTGNTPGVKASDLQLLSWFYDEMSSGLLSRSYKGIADENGLSKKGVKGAVERLESAGFLRVERGATPFVYKKTRPGQAVTELEGGVGNTGNGVDDVSTVKSNVHDLGVEFYLSDESLLMERDRESLLGTFDFLGYDEDSGEYFGDWDRFHFRLSGDKVVVYRRGDEQGLSATYVKEEALRDVVRCREFLEDELNLRFEDGVVVEARVIGQDVSIEDHPLVIAARKAGVDVSPERFHSVDGDGNVRLKLDLSGGVNGELEASMRGPLSSDARMEESDIQRELDDILWRKENWSEWERVKMYGEDREIVMGALQYLLMKEIQEEKGTTKQDDESVLDEEAGRDAPGDARERSITDELSVSSKWLDCHGNLMGWVEELERPMKLVDKEDLP